jgi:hypothetical protein
MAVRGYAAFKKSYAAPPGTFTKFDVRHGSKPWSLYATMRYILYIQFLTIAFISFEIGADKDYLLYGGASQYQTHQTISHSCNTLDTVSTVVTIDSLKVGQSYFVNVESNGCFHHSNFNLIITKEINGYFASFRMEGKIEGKKVSTKFKRTKLSDHQIDSVRNFERQLLLVSASRYDCTTVDNYTLAVDTIKKSYTVDKCDWQGIGKLVGDLFKKTK